MNLIFSQQILQILSHSGEFCFFEIINLWRSFFTKWFTNWLYEFPTSSAKPRSEVIKTLMSFIMPIEYWSSLSVVHSYKIHEKHIFHFPIITARTEMCSHSGKSLLQFWGLNHYYLLYPTMCMSKCKCICVNILHCKMSKIGIQHSLCEDSRRHKSLFLRLFVPFYPFCLFLPKKIINNKWIE